MLSSVIGCGNANRCDDGAGPAVIQQLREKGLHQLTDIRLFDAGTAGMEVMFQARGSDRLILIDACVSNATPGALFRLSGDDLAQHYEGGQNLHDFRWQHALYAGARIYGSDFPNVVEVWLIEAESLQLGLNLSAAVAATCARLAADLDTTLRQGQAA